jgi:HlyD family secretion protein
MAAGTSVAILRDIQTLFDSGTANGLSDRQLLERFASRGGASAEAAFELLVLRHGPMVLRVCRNVLGDSSDAQDAFQATFLVLVRRRGSIGGMESLGGWLYGVACRVAARARVESARRRAVEQRASLRIVEAVDSSEPDRLDIAALGPVIQEEVRRLPEKYRAVVALCYWQGLTHEQAAVQLGCPLGTVRSRMARARDLLRRRLTHRGLAPLAGVVATTLDSADASARAFVRFSVPHELVHSTIRAASQVATGQATAQVVSGLVSSLVQRVLWSMTMSKISSVVVGVALVGLMSYGARLAVSQSQVAPTRQEVIKKKSRYVPEQADITPNSTKSYSIVKGQTTIMRIVADGSTVKKGDIVCELDSASLRDQLVNQLITRKSAEANYENAKLTRQVAERDVTDYTEDFYPRELRETQAEGKVAAAELALAEEQLKAAKAAAGFNELEIKRGELALARAKLAGEKATNRLHILEGYTKGKQIKQLQTNVLNERSNELAKKAVWELEHSKVRGLERQIESCGIKAPRDGILVYANPPVGQKLIEVGATVRERQALFQIFTPAEAKAGEP